jgi:DNA-binding GntR family transcriptional regulator
VRKVRTAFKTASKKQLKEAAKLVRAEEAAVDAEAVSAQRDADAEFV